MAFILAGTPVLAEGWDHYGGDAGGTRYTPAAQITTANVAALETAWTARTGHAHEPGFEESAFEATPILVAGSLVLCSPFNTIIAFDPGTGAEKWRFDPSVSRDQDPANQYVCRGVASWRDTSAAAAPACRTRIFMGTNDSRLIAVDAETGRPCAGFGDTGQVTIDPGMDLLWPGEFQITSPPVVVGDTVIVGSSISDNARLEAPNGAVRAYDARSGRLRWTFDPIPRTDDHPERDSWEIEGTPRQGHANAWAPMSVDEERGLVFVPTSSPSPDFYGGERPGDNRYANSVVALDAATGSVVWHFQTVHHDVWDYDVPAQPGLYEAAYGSEPVPVVVQATKMGLVFVLDRETGEPVIPVEERPVPQYGAEGEQLSPTQPFPVKPRPLVPPLTLPDDAWGISFWDRGACRKTLEKLRYEGLYTPPGVQGTLIYPYTGGGANWGGMAFDPARRLAFVNTSRAPHVVQLIRPEHFDEMRHNHPDQEISPQRGARFAMRRNMVFSPLGLPCTPPPWGMLHAIDLDTGDIVWETPFGTTKDIAPLGVEIAYGTPNLGGPIVTAGGLLFIGAAMDDFLRAYDVETGEELWRGRLPAGGQATPMSYMWEGRQYVVIAVGGHSRMTTTLGDYVVAFALPHP